MSWLSFLFGGQRNVIAETAEVFRPNAENSAQRAADHATAALNQYAAEFHHRTNRTWFDALVDGLNRLVRPLVTVGAFAPLVLTYTNPAEMAKVWAALATLPQGYWAVLGLILPFYFGGRMQVKALSAASWKEASKAAAALAPIEELEEENAALEEMLND